MENKNRNHKGHDKGPFIAVSDGLDRILMNLQDGDNVNHSQDQGTGLVSAPLNIVHSAEAKHKTPPSDEDRAHRLAGEFATVQRETQTLLDAAKARLMSTVQQELRNVLADIIDRPDGLPMPQAGISNMNGIHTLTNPYVSQQAVDKGAQPGQADIEVSSAKSVEVLPTQKRGQPDLQVAEGDLLSSISDKAKNGTLTKPVAELVETQPTSVKVQESTARATEGLSRREGAPEKPAEGLDEKVYEGTIHMSVIIVDGRVNQMLRFVDELTQKPQIRLLRLLGNHRSGMDLWVGLRQPLELKRVLLNMNGVAKVSNMQGLGPEGSETHLSIQLAGAS